MYHILYLEILLLEVGPEPLDDLAPGQLLVLLGPHNGGQGRGQAHRLRQAALPLLPGAGGLWFSWGPWHCVDVVQDLLLIPTV